VASRSKTGRNEVTAPIFLLAPQVKLPKRIDLGGDAERALDSVPGLIAASWGKAVVKWERWTFPESIASLRADSGNG
jgi:hypothetical protein